MIGIYKITNPKGKVYIGQSRDLKKRELQYSKYLKRYCRQLKLVNSIKKYKWELHIFEVIEYCDFNLLNIKERYWQEFYDSIEKGLNCIYTKTLDKPALFGLETRERMRKSHIGKTLSYSHKLKISESKKGISIGVGKILTEKHKKAISNGFKAKFNDDELKKIIEMYNNNISLRKISLKFNSNHTTIKKYIKTEIEKL
jgi:group I intron endonuclease